MDPLWAPILERTPLTIDMIYHLPDDIDISIVHILTIILTTY